MMMLVEDIVQDANAAIGGGQRVICGEHNLLLGASSDPNDGRPSYSLIRIYLILFLPVQLITHSCWKENLLFFCYPLLLFI
jgi:hypothetical protein